MECTFILFAGLACPGAAASVSSVIHVLIGNKEVFLLLLSRFHAHTEQYSVCELLCNSDYDMNLGIFASSCSWEVA